MFSGVDWVTVLIFVLLVGIGWLNIFAVNFNEESFTTVVDLSKRYGVQLLWISVSFVAAITVLLIDKIFFHFLSYPTYFFILFLLVSVLIFGTEVNGAKSWFEIGSFRLQPAELGKFATSLALARHMSSYNFNMKNSRSLLGVMLIIMVPFAIIILQNDTGSALVYAAFFIMLYREGFNQWFYIFGLLAIALFIFSFLFSPIFMVLFMLVIALVAESVSNGYHKEKVIYLGTVVLTYFVASVVIYLLGASEQVPSNLVAIGAVVVTLPLVFIYGYRRQLRNLWLFVMLFVGALSFTSSIDYIFNNVMQQHQKDRIYILLGLVTDNKGTGYNVNQSKIAIGSGGFSGKGFLNGTQTKFNFVPEQSTDFIFCTVGEEWGFVGCSLVVILFTVLITRLMYMGERQKDAFARIYCYSVASIFIAHLIINIGMTIGLIPVIGIPLPFFSYGGSSLLSFTVLLFVAIRLDAARGESDSQF